MQVWLQAGVQDIRSHTETAKLRVALALDKDLSRMQTQLQPSRQNAFVLSSTLSDESLVGVLARNRDNLEAAGCLIGGTPKSSSAPRLHIIKATLAPYSADNRLWHEIKGWRMDSLPAKHGRQVS